jgi:hypothetical protein
MLEDIQLIFITFKQPRFWIWLHHHFLAYLESSMIPVSELHIRSVKACITALITTGGH